MNWTEIIGHANIIKRLRSITTDGSFPHAMIFAGVRGIGKYTIAELTAAALLCESSSEAPCGKCASCRALRAGSHPDLFRIAPDSTAKNPTIKIAQIREMLGGIALEPMISDLRVILIDDAHTMNAISQNSILKTIEEPVGRSAFILVTDRRSDLLITLRSRCITLNFDRLTVEEIAKGLRARGLDESIAELADGSLGRALQLSEEGGLEMRRNVLDVLNRLDRMTIAEVFALTEELSKNPRGAISDWLTCLEKFLRDMLLADVNARLYNEDVRFELATRRQAFGERRIFEMFDRALEAQRRLSTNADLRLICDALLLRMRRSV